MPQPPPMPDRSAIPTATHLRSRVGRVCIALQAPSVEAMLRRAEAALNESAFLEFRLDSLANPVAGVLPIAAFLAQQRARRGEVAAIATCRRTVAGGNFQGSLSAELDILTRAAQAGFSLLDLEIESAEQLGPEKLAPLRVRWEADGAALLLSFHDFHSAADPEPVFQRIQRFAPDFVKIVTTAPTLSASLDLLTWLKAHADNAQLVAIAMGEPGIVSRVLSLRAGGAFTFAAAPDGSETAPGQMTARTLKDLYRIEELNQATRIYGVAGNPIAHSLSPLMHNTAFRRERLNSVYLPLKTEKLEDLLHLVHRLPLSGLSVTMPLKVEILPHLANIDPLAARIGACNTVLLGEDGKLQGFNTDAAGIVRPLEKRLPLKSARILVLGAGGASRAAVYALAEKGAEVHLWSRDPAKTEALAAEAGVQPIARNQIPTIEFDALVNGTPCGMVGHPHPLPLEHREWQAKLVFELVYNPLDTPLLQQARLRGIPVIQGVEMFVQQGARQFELWTGKPAPEAEMQRVVLFALQQAQASRNSGQS